MRVDWEEGSGRDNAVCGIMDFLHAVFCSLLKGFRVGRYGPSILLVGGWRAGAGEGGAGGRRGSRSLCVLRVEARVGR